MHAAGALVCVLQLLPGCDDDTVISTGTDLGVGDMDAPDLGAQAETAPIVQVLLPGATVPKYVDPLPTFAGKRVTATNLAVDIVEFQQKILPAAIYAALPAPYDAGTYQWGYDVDHTGASMPATTIEAQQNTTTTVTYTNDLQRPGGAAPVLERYLVNDATIHWADPLGTSEASHCMDGPPLAEACLETFAGPIPTVVHLHGAAVASSFDGNPDSWFTQGLARHGPGYAGNIYQYPNAQEATTLWFHDHALGRVRLDVYAGMAGMYLIRDARDTGLATNPIGLPAGAYEVELFVADRQFDRNGQLFFPSGTPGNPNGLNGPPPNPDQHPYWIPELFGDVVTVNGKSWPYLEVEPRRYRFRVVNGANARFFRMQLVDGLSTSDGGSATPGPAIWQIGSDGGLLDAPAKLADPADATSPQLFLAPAERADVIIDFAGQAGKTFTLVNDAAAPFPAGDAPDPDTTAQVMQFRVVKPLQGSDTTFDPSTGGALRAQPIVDIRPTVARPADEVRQLVLVEIEGPGGPIEVLLNNSKWDGLEQGTTTPLPGSTTTSTGAHATEAPQVGTTETWEILNLTEDAHPIHVHLVQFQLINRQPLALQGDGDDPAYLADWVAAFPGATIGSVTYAPGTFIPGFGPPQPYDVPNAAGALGGNPAFTAQYFAAAPIAPGPGETGWKDTIKVPPKQVTRIAVRFAPQDAAVSAVSAGTQLFPFDPSSGPGYVWHCHILDHEDNEMMRPMVLSK